MNKWDTDVDYITAWIIFCAIAGFSVFLVMTILWGLSVENQSIAKLNRTWHKTIAISSSGTLITPDGNSTQVTYKLDGKTFDSEIFWKCYTPQSTTPPAGTKVLVYADDHGDIYCNTSYNNSPTPKATYGSGFPLLNIFGSIVAGLISAALGWCLAVLSWAGGCTVGEWLDRRQKITL